MSSHPADDDEPFDFEVRPRSGFVDVDRVTLCATGSWADFAERLASTMAEVLDGPTRVVILDVDDDRYVQMQFGGGDRAALVEVSAGTTDDREVIAALLLEAGFRRPGETTDGVRSPNWSTELPSFRPTALAAIFTQLFRDAMRLEPSEVTLSTFRARPRLLPPSGGAGPHGGNET